MDKFNDLFHNIPEGYLAIFWTIIIIALVIGYTIEILFILTLHNTMKAVSIQNRAMPIGQLWLLLIPLFGTVWIFIVVNKLSQSIEKEFLTRSVAVEPRPTYSIGLTYSILGASTILPIPIINSLIAFAALICWIIYWIKVGEYKNRLRNLPPIQFSESQIFGNTIPQ